MHRAATLSSAWPGKQTDDGVLMNANGCDVTDMTGLLGDFLLSNFTVWSGEIADFIVGRRTSL